MLRAVIFDFNGVIIDDEPIHFRAMQDAVARIGIRITEEEYYAQYLPFDDARCLRAICANHGVVPAEAEGRRVLEDKSRCYREMLTSRIPLFRGADTLIRRLASRLPLAIASGARRQEIEQALGEADLRSCFRVIVAAEDFTHGKPDPESFLFALDRLNATLGDSARPVRPAECVVIEDSVGGVQGARAAGMVCVAVTNSYPRGKLAEAHRVVDSLDEISPENLAALFEVSR